VNNLIDKTTPIARFFQYDNLDWYRRFLLSLRYNINPRDYNNFADIIAKSMNQIHGFGAPSYDGDDATTLEDWARGIRQEGYVELGQMIDQKSIDEILEYLKGRKTSYLWDKSLPPFLPDDAPEQVSVASYDQTTIAMAPHLVRLANHPRIISVLHRYLGMYPSLMSLEAFWSFPRDQAEHAQLFHVDQHCYRFCKLFLYLTDVDEESGPHVYVSGSGDYAAHGRLLKEKSGGDPALFAKYQEMLRKQRKTDDEVEELFGKDRIVTKTGKAGTVLLGNTGSLHKGQLPKSKKRLIFSALYTMLPTIKDEVSITPLAHLRDEINAAYPGVYTNDQIAYLNRLVAV
jgi:hypothetical protein